MSRDYDKMLSLSDDYRFKIDRARLNFLKAQGTPIDYRIMSVDECTYKLKMRNVVVNMIPSSSDYKTVEYESEKVDDSLEDNI
ncbi:hypothetical protein [Paenibacillus sp. Aloe-11]|uniref:hypothetical protein n=1 Tax=Paenibacillus sp. Aloe-11 TaxID=1050222 RepID=UPI001E2E8797|nr:hypothetical protein [Paenibacillus sp. Aloe-11]